MGENDNIIIHKLLQNHNALGIVGYSFLDNNRDFLYGAKINGVEPNYDNIKNPKICPNQTSLFMLKKINIKLMKT